MHLCRLLTAELSPEHAAHRTPHVGLVVVDRDGVRVQQVQGAEGHVQRPGREVRQRRGQLQPRGRRRRRDGRGAKAGLAWNDDVSTSYARTLLYNYNT